MPRRISFDNYKRGLPELITRADQSTLSRVVDDNGWVTSETDGNGVTVTYDYTDAGWLKTIDRPSVPDAWSDTTITYSSLGNGIVQTSTRGTTKVTTSYDSLARPYLVKTEPTNGDGTTSYVATDYDALSQVIFTSFPVESLPPPPTPLDGTFTTYDSLGRKLVETENVAPNATTSYVYEANHRTKVTDPENRITYHDFHAFGDPDDAELHHIYQPHNGSAISTWMYRNDYGQTTRIRQHGFHGTEELDYSHYFYMDAQERVCRMSTPEGGHTVYQYNAAYEMIAYAKGVDGSTTSCVTPAGSSRVALEYDDLGRLEKTLFDDADTPDIIRSYDGNGNLLTVDRDAASPANDVELTYTYDSANNIRSEELVIDGRTYTLGYDYHSDGHLEQRTYPGNVVIDYTLNGLGQPKTVQNGSTVYVSNAVYHANGSLESATYGNGHSLINTWTPRQQLDRNYIHDGGTNVAVDLDYGYNARGQVTSITDGVDAGNNRVYGYDDVGRLETASGPWGSGSFDIDPLGNIRSKTLGSVTDTISYDAITNRASSHTRSGQSARTIQYNETLDRGNVTDLGGMAFSYDYSDQPVAQTGSVAADYRYDGNRRRAYQDLDGKEIYSFYDAAGALVHRDDDTAGEATNYIAAAGTVLRLEDAGTGYAIGEYTFSDHLGSPLAATGSTAPVTWRERYKPFGEKITDPAENRDEPGFTSHVQDDATGLTYMQARFYDPMLGRFLSIDPVGFSPEKPYMFNRYSYVGNDPINLVDPFGMYGSCAEFRDAGNTQQSCAEIEGITGVPFDDERELAQAAGNALNALSAADKNEWGIAFSRNEDGNLTASVAISGSLDPDGIASGDPAGITMSTLLDGVDNPVGDGHTHGLQAAEQLQVESPDDIRLAHQKAYNGRRKGGDGKFNSYVYTASGRAHLIRGDSFRHPFSRNPTSTDIYRATDPSVVQRDVFRVSRILP